MRACTLIVIGLLGCTKAGPAESVEPPPSHAQPPAARPPTATATVAITAVTLSGDCGTGPVRAEEGKGRGDHDEARRACEQSSLQLSVVGAPSGAPVPIRVKRIELIDDKGKLISALTSRTPTVWAKTGSYEAWDQNVAATQTLAVSYALGDPNWGGVANPYDRTYVLKAVITIGASDQTLQRDVHLAAPTFLPAMVDT